MKKMFLLFLFASIVLSLPAAFKRINCGFKLAKLRFEMPFRPDLEIASPLSKSELLSILCQPYSYLDKGAQCYVFQSSDQKYVIKLFRYDKKTSASFEKKIEKLFSACILAYEKGQRETGLIYLHLNPTLNELPTLHATGPLHQSLHLKLDQYRFALQKKAEPFRRSLLIAALSQDPSAMQRRIDSFIALLHSRLNKGIGNSDPAVSRNFGFLGDQAVEIDFGNYYLFQGNPNKELQRHTVRLRRWLERNIPEWVSYLDLKTNCPVGNAQSAE